MLGFKIGWWCDRKFWLEFRKRWLITKFRNRIRNTLRLFVNLGALSDCDTKYILGFTIGAWCDKKLWVKFRKRCLITKFPNYIRKALGLFVNFGPLSDPKTTCA